MIGRILAIVRHFDPRVAWHVPGLMALSLVAALLEMISIGAFLPLMHVAIDPAAAAGRAWLAPLHAWLAPASPQHFLLQMALLVFLAFALKSAFLAVLLHVQNTYVFRKQAEFSARLFESYLARPMAFHLERNSAELLRNVTASVYLVFTNGLLPLLNLTLDGLMAVGTVAILLSVEPVGAVAVALLLGGTTGGLYWAVRNRLKRWGETAETVSAGLNRHVLEALGAIKEIKVLGVTGHFAHAFAGLADERCRVLSLSATFNQLPRMALEAVSVGAMVVVMAIAVWAGGQPGEVMATLGIFAVAAFRLLPSVNRVLTQASVLKYGSAAIDNIHGDLVSPPPLPPADDAPHLCERLIVDNVRFHYAGASRPALDGVSATIAAGSMVGLVGGSGAGKTTFVDLLLGLHRPTEGRVLVDGRAPGANWCRRVGYVPQHIFLSDDTLRRNIALGIADEAIDEGLLAQAVALAQLDGVVAGLPHGLDTRVGEAGARLSGGQRQRIGIARALYRQPDVLVLDEATSALDAETERGVTQALDALRGHTTIVVVAHRLSTVRHCDRLLVFENGRIIDDGGFDDLYGRNAVFKRLVELGDLKVRGEE